MHQLVQVPGIITGFYRELPAVLFDSLGGSQEADNGLFPLCPLVQRTPGRLAAGIDAQGGPVTNSSRSGPPVLTRRSCDAARVVFRPGCCVQAFEADCGLRS
jgi:hypothetical protein